MNNYWWNNVVLILSKLVIIWIFQRNNSISCLSLNYEGNALLKFKERVVNDPFGALSSWKVINGDANPCSWFGVGCAGGHVVSLDLKNFCLEGTIAPELHHLWHIQFIVLRNNSFSGVIPGEIGNLKELKLLDVGYNNFCKAFADDTKLDIPIILLDNNDRSCYNSPELDGNLVTNSVKVLPYSREYDYANDVGSRRILKVGQPSSKEMKSDKRNNVNLMHQSGTHSSSPSTSKPKSTSTNPPRKSIGFPPTPPLHPSSILPQRKPSHPPPSPQELSPQPPTPQSIPAPDVSLLEHTSRTRAPRTKLIMAVAVSGFIGLILVSLLIFVLRNKKVRETTGLSGQLQKALVTGIPNIKRSELEAACEDFSNVIGSSSIGTIYKGTLSNGVEIAVISLSVTSAKDWSRNLETQFRNKIEVLSKVNHKNFVNLMGYCEEEEPFTKLMVFEYAPNGSLFEHLHVREAEHLEWGMRLRVAMGMAYCLDHMHQLTPPVTHPNLNSSAVSLSEDYATKLSDFCFWNEVAARQVQPMITNSSSTLSVSPASNVFSFGLVLLEMMTGRIPRSFDNNSLDDWVSEYMSGELHLQEMVDPMLRHFDTDQLDKMGDVIKKCLHSEQNRPTMREITTRLREITCINQEAAVPRYSSLWWAELDARSMNGA